MSDEYQSLPPTDQQVPVEFGPSAERGVSYRGFDRNGASSTQRRLSDAL